MLMSKDEMGAPLLKNRSMRGNERGVKEQRSSQSQHSDFNLLHGSDIEKDTKYVPAMERNAQEPCCPYAKIILELCAISTEKKPHP